ncbi:MAG: winged helix-turn-helix domain-containing protein [Planctomycetaceae bacterium]
MSKHWHRGVIRGRGSNSRWRSARVWRSSCWRGRGAGAHGFSTDLWTAPRVQRLLREQYGVEYHVNDIPALLRKLRFTPHQPETRARERHADEIAQGRECDWPRRKTKRAGRAP